MDKLVTVFYGGTIQKNGNGGIDLERMQDVSLLFGVRPSFVRLMDTLKERLGWMEEAVNVKLQGVIDVGSSKGPRIKRLVPIGRQAEWDNYVSIVMDSEVRALDVFVQKFKREQDVFDQKVNREASYPMVQDVVVQKVESGFSCRGAI
ncbi:hypothetical protein BS78_08G071000 [Paspalum vaginatum]|nr:hypothetical protein BS78_08G071000 [Paspalum vaginatum]